MSAGAQRAPSAVEQLLRHERRVVLGALALAIAAAWAYTLAGAGMGEAQSGVRHAVGMLAMWWVMMVAMMLPSAAPAILLAAALNRRSAQPPYGAAGFFTAGYLLAWLGFSLAAVVVHGALAASGLLSATMRASNPTLAGALLLAAGLWQVTPLKQACLRHCRSPIDQLTRYRRPGNLGALSMGVRHGGYCLGCCVFLMALLFVGGVMSPLWIAGLALFVLAEKLLARGVWFSRAAGAALVTAGVLVLAR